MPEVISFANMKGGVGKSTLCVNLAYSLFLRKNKVLIIDNDPQFNATSALLSPIKYINEVLRSEDNHSVYHIYEREPRVHGKKPTPPNPLSFFQTTWRFDNGISLDLIPSQIELYETLRNPSQKEYLLDKFIEKHASHYDYIFIDCPPTPSVLTLSAFAASKHVVIPVAPDFYATLGLPQFLGTLEDFKEDLVDRHDISVLGVVFTNCPRKEDPQTNRAYTQVRKALKARKDAIPIFDTRMSHFKVYGKTLWQARPVQQVVGRGNRGKGAAMAELRSIAEELVGRIADRNEA